MCPLVSAGVWGCAPPAPDTPLWLQSARAASSSTCRPASTAPCATPRSTRRSRCSTSSWTASCRTSSTSWCPACRRVSVPGAGLGVPCHRGPAEEPGGAQGRDEGRDWTFLGGTSLRGVGVCPWVFKTLLTLSVVDPKPGGRDSLVCQTGCRGKGRTNGLQAWQQGPGDRGDRAREAHGAARARGAEGRALRWCRAVWKVRVWGPAGGSGRAGAPRLSLGGASRRAPAGWGTEQGGGCCARAQLRPRSELRGRVVGLEPRERRPWGRALSDGAVNRWR